MYMYSLPISLFSYRFVSDPVHYSPAVSSVILSRTVRHRATMWPSYRPVNIIALTKVRRGKREGERDKSKKLNFIIVKIIQTACHDNYFCSSLLTLPLPFPPLSLSLIVLRTCSITRDNCEVTYQVGIYVLGTEGSITVLFDQSQDDINDWSGKEQYI